MDVTNVETGQQVKKIMDRMDPMSKNGVLFLQALAQNGKGYLVDEYEKIFAKEEEL